MLQSVGTKVTAEQIAEIRSSEMSGRELALKFRVTPQYISMIRRGQNPSTARRDPAEVAKEMADIQTLTPLERETIAIDEIMQCVIAGIRDVKLMPQNDKRDKRLMFLTKCFKDCQDAKAGVGKRRDLGDLTDEQIAEKLLKAKNG